MKAKNILVTEPHLPSRETFDAYVDQIWSRNWLTNGGPLVRELETRLSQHLGVDNMAYVANGTIALQLALEALNIKGEVLTTAFSFVATASSVAWQKLTPKMVDVSPLTLNIDPYQIERNISPATTCILATHVFGNPCDVDAIDRIAKRHGLKVIYDGAHAFGTQFQGRSLLDFGDASIVSFHATKLYHSIEGGGVVIRDADAFDRVCRMRNFGMGADGHIDMVGINGKNSEFHAAMGLSNLAEIDLIMKKRRMISAAYDRALRGSPLVRPTTPGGCVYNYAYYPVIFESESVMLNVLEALSAAGIFARRYFYPSLSTLPYVDKGMGTPVSDDVALRVACLPIHTHMTLHDTRRVTEALKACFTPLRRQTRLRAAS